MFPEKHCFSTNKQICRRSTEGLEHLAILGPWPSWQLPWCCGTGATPRWQSSTVCRPHVDVKHAKCAALAKRLRRAQQIPCRHETTGFLKDQKEYERRKPESNTTWKPIKQYKDGPSFGIHRFIYSSVWRYWLFLILRSRGVAARVMVLVACN